MDGGDFQGWVDEQMRPSVERAGESEAVANGRAAFAANCSSCHRVTGLNDDTYDGAPVESNAAPDLTHFASRTTFAGGLLNTYNEDGSFNRNDVSAWLRAPEEIKDNAANNLPDGVLPRGMPNLGLSERTISDLVAYLESLGERPGDWVIAATEVE